MPPQSSPIRQTWVPWASLRGVSDERPIPEMADVRDALGCELPMSHPHSVASACRVHAWHISLDLRHGEEHYILAAGGNLRPWTCVLFFALSRLESCFIVVIESLD